MPSQPTASPAPAKRRRLRGPGHVIATVLWMLVAAWLVLSIFLSVIGSLFFGDGPLNPPTRTPTPGRAAPASPGP